MRPSTVRGYVLTFVGTAAGLLVGETIVRMSHYRYHRDTLADIVIPGLTLLGCWLALRIGRQARAFMTSLASTTFTIGAVIALAGWIGPHIFLGYRIVVTSALVIVCTAFMARGLVTWVPRLRLRVAVDVAAA